MSNKAVRELPKKCDFQKLHRVFVSIWVFSGNKQFSSKFGQIWLIWNLGQRIAWTWSKWTRSFSWGTRQERISNNEKGTRQERISKNEKGTRQERMPLKSEEREKERFVPFSVSFVSKCDKKITKISQIFRNHPQYLYFTVYTGCSSQCGFFYHKAKINNTFSKFARYGSCYSR